MRETMRDSTRQRTDEGTMREALAYADPLYNLARHLTNDAAAAEDLVQETYARAFAAIDSFAVGTNLKAWLFRILRNTQIDHDRRKKSVPRVADDDPDAHADEAFRWDDVELDRLRNVIAADIEAALASLAIDQRAAILLDLEGLTEAEMADVLGCAPGTVKSRLSRARAALRVKLREYGR